MPYSTNPWWDGRVEKKVGVDWRTSGEPES